MEMTKLKIYAMVIKTLRILKAEFLQGKYKSIMSWNLSLCPSVSLSRQYKQNVDVHQMLFLYSAKITHINSITIFKCMSQVRSLWLRDCCLFVDVLLFIFFLIILFNKLGFYDLSNELFHNFKIRNYYS